MHTTMQEKKLSHTATSSQLSRGGLRLEDFLIEISDAAGSSLTD
jgi:hypothetical protein